jgi:hypothetical protein
MLDWPERVGRQVATWVEQMSSVITVSNSRAEWLSKADAAAFLRVSSRQIERRAAQGYVEARRLPRRPTERSERVVYSRVDLEAIRDGKPNQHGIPDDSVDNSAKPTGAVEISPVQPAKAAALAHTAPPGAWETLAGAFAARFAPAAPVPPWLTLREAAEYSGLPASWLEREARAGNAFALNVGSAKRASWRFSRNALG